jgi:coenzyme F420-dependent glucose-6-phosphate dehydrogenase
MPPTSTTNGITLGYALSSEEHPPNDMVDYAVRAEELGFEFIGISDHFHPWVGEQGHSPFVWAVLGGIARATERIRIGTGVTCPTVRTHPGVVAQAAATVEAMMPGRFFLGVGSGENLNEHVWGDRWPPIEQRLEMLEEAVEVIRELWTGESVTRYGKHYTVENARIYTLPPSPPPIVVAASGTKAAELAGRIGDGFWGTAPESETIEAFAGAGGSGPRYGQVTVCWAADEAEARKTAHSVWPNAGVKGYLSADLPTPKHFEQAAQMVTEDDVAELVVCGPDVAKHVEQIKAYADAGYDHIYVHQVGRDQDGWFRFAESELLPALRDRGLLS